MIPYRQELVRKWKMSGHSRQEIRYLVDKFQRTVNVADVKCSGMSSMAIENLQAIDEPIKRSYHEAINYIYQTTDVALCYKLNKRLYPNSGDVPS